MYCPSISLVAWEDRTPGFIFVAIPNERGRYLRTDACVSLVPCPYQGCESIRGEPCREGPGEYRGSTHAVRRDLVKGLHKTKSDVIKPHFKLKLEKEMKK